MTAGCRPVASFHLLAAGHLFSGEKKVKVNLQVK
jgi:hypothetical protein